MVNSGIEYGGRLFQFRYLFSKAAFYLQCLVFIVSKPYKAVNVNLV